MYLNLIKSLNTASNKVKRSTEEISALKCNHGGVLQEQFKTSEIKGTADQVWDIKFDLHSLLADVECSQSFMLQYANEVEMIISLGTSRIFALWTVDGAT